MAIVSCSISYFANRSRGYDTPIVDDECSTTGQIAHILRPSTSRVRALAAAGELEAERDESNDWRLLARAVHACMSERPPREPDPTEEIRRLFMSVECARSVISSPGDLWRVPYPSRPRRAEIEVSGPRAGLWYPDL
jgi:hypothetical protein